MPQTTQDSQSETFDKTVEKQSRTDKPWLFKKGESGNLNGRPKKTEVQRILEKQVKDYLKDYEQGLAEALPEIQPALIKEAQKGNVKAIREIHEVVGAHKNKGGNTIIPIQVNFKGGEYD